MCGNSGFPTRIVAVLVVLVGASVENAVAAAGPAAQGFLIRFSAKGRVEVVPFRVPASGRVDREKGIAIWERGGQEHWAAVPGKLFDPNKRAAPKSESPLQVASRGSAASGVAIGPGQMTFQPDQLLSLVVVRAGETSFLTPPDQGFHLDGKITLRRRPLEGDNPYPAAKAVLRDGNRELLTIPFAKGKATLRWSEIPKLPADLQSGLPPGAYTLALAEGPATSFNVESADVRDWVRQPLDGLAALVGPSDPIYLLAATQHVLDQIDEDDKPRSYLADALDMLDQVEGNDKAAWIVALRSRLERRLSGEEAEALSDPAATEIEAIDQARAAIQSGNWSLAMRVLDELPADAPQRDKALATLYQAVIAAESGLSASESPDASFKNAIRGLKDGSPADRFRAHNNYGGVLFARARDRIHNHAFQMATGVKTPLLRTVADWSAAREQYELALAQAETLPPTLAAGLRVNLAQLYELLADLISVLDYSPGGERTFDAGESAARAAAAEYAEQATANASDELDPLTRGAAHEILAQLAYHRGDNAACQEQATAALEQYLAAGALAGVESIERLRGLSLTRDLEVQSEPPASLDEGLKHLQVSHKISELLRERISAQNAGQSRAGFFARRTYVNERIVELLIARQDHAQALSFAEGSKARSLQDLLTASSADDKGSQDDSRTLEEILAEWPDDVAAVEYFLGSQRCYVFLVSRTGEVQAWPLVDEQGDVVASRDLVRRVQQLLSGMEGHARKMLADASRGRGFDQTWQNELHAFYRLLLPPPVAEELRSVRTALFVPHHVLHYFPFAALVTETDTVARGKLEQPQPRFLVDEPFALCKAPSIVAWDLLRHRPGEFSQAQAVGIVNFSNAPPLPGVERDLANLRHAFGTSLQSVLEQDAAGEGRVKQALAQPGMLFIGTHGKNVAEQPLSSFLLCHPDEENDGRLTAEELFAADVSAQLVVLSACYSGLADQSPLPGDDLFGLERAFLESGAATVVSGLWDVYDDTGPLVLGEFLHALAAQQPAAPALAEAQRAFLVQRRSEGPGDPWIHPYFWAVYTISGSDLTAFDPRRVGQAAIE